jgi:Tfp pilus assembly protein PilF
MASYAKRTPDGAADALDEFKAAIRLDSSYSEAWVGLAKTYVRAYERRFVFIGAARDSALRLALSALDHALAADPHNADAWLAQGMVHGQLDPTDRAPSLRSYRQAVAMDSTLAQAWHQLGIASMEIGRTDEAMAAWRRTVAVGPTYTEGLSFLALGHYWGRQYDSASHWADSAAAIDPAFAFARQVQGLIAVEQSNFARSAAAFSAMERISTGIEVVNSLAGEALLAARAGRRTEARALLTRAESLATNFSPTASHTALYMAQPYAALGDADHAIAWLRQYAPTADTHFQLHMRCDPPFDAIANDSRFRSLLIIPKPAPPHGC